MDKLLNEEITKQVKEFLAEMVNPVTLAVFTKESGCETCPQTVQLLNEVKELSDKITVVEYDLDKNKDEAKKYNVTLAPSFVMLDKDGKYQGVRFNGIPAGHEFNSFLNAVIFMSGYNLGFEKDLIEKVKNIKTPIDIKVFVTLSCPHCPGAVTTAQRLAMLNDNIEASMIESQTFMALASKYKVSGVPKIVINDKYELLGNQPVEAFLAEFDKIA
jgi:glutaredoxin-like protein